MDMSAAHAASQPSKGMKVLLAIAVLVAWYSLIMQWVLIFENRQLDYFRTFLRYFSFFTILTNLLTAIYYSARLLFPSSQPSSYFARNNVSSSITAYMIFVGLAYTFLLRHLWNPQGQQLIVDELLHTVNPLLILVFWLIYVPRAGSRWFDFLPWLVYPAGYLVYALLVSPLITLYPYPFLDVVKLGIVQVLKNSVGLLAAFSALSLILIAIDRGLKRA